MKKALTPHNLKGHSPQASDKLMKSCSQARPRALKREHTGFTLIEILIAISIFFIVIVSVVGIFVSALKQQRKSLNRVYLLNHSSYVTEYLSRALRMVRKDRDGQCIGTANLNFSQPAGPGSLRFLKEEKEAGGTDLVLICQEVYVDNGVLRIKRSTDDTANFVYIEDLSPTDMVVQDIGFAVSGDGQGDDIQPNITFFMLMEAGGTDAESLRFQSSVSQRELDVIY